MMKHKKFLVTAIMLIVCTAVVFADLAISFGAAYTNYLVQPKNGGKLTGDAVKDTFIKQLNDSKTHSEIATAFSDNLKRGAFIMDTQIGAGYTFLKNTKFNLFLGGGVGLNLVSSEQTLSVAGYNVGNYKKLDAMLGVGANITASFYFTKHIGIYAGIADTVYFAPIKAKKTFTVAGQAIDLDKNSDVKFSNSFANSLNLKAGISFKL